MTRFSITATAVLLLAPSLAQAKVPVLDLGSICDFMPIVINNPNVNGFSHYTCSTGNFVGLISTVGGTQSVVASIQIKHKREPFLLQLSYPLKDGGSWSIFYTRNGYAMKLYQGGTYNVIK